MGSRRTSGGSRHLRFEKHLPMKGRKMPTYIVYNDEFEECIGNIHWRGGWRQYVWQADPEVDMTRSCQKEIIKFTDKIMKDWREGLKRRKK